MTGQRLTRLALTLCLLTVAVEARAHRGAPPEEKPPAPVFKLEKLSDRVWCLYGRGGNVGFLVTPVGVAVVDDQYENMAQGIVEQIRSVTDSPIRWVINTHYHSDHAGGNAVFVRLAEILAHDNVRPRLLEYPRTILATFPARIESLEQEIAGIDDSADPYRLTLEKDRQLFQFFLDSARSFKVEEAAPPGLTYQGRVNLWLEDQEIRIFHVGPGHTDGDSMVYFRNENVLHMGDLFWNGMVPFIDAAGGGSAMGMIESLDHALATIPLDAKVIPGHGPATDMAGLRRFRDFLVDLRGEVGLAIKSGMKKADAVRIIRMEAYPEIKPAFRTLGNVISVLYDELQTR